MVRFLKLDVLSTISERNLFSFTLVWTGCFTRKVCMYNLLTFTARLMVVLWKMFCFEVFIQLPRCLRKVSQPPIQLFITFWPICLHLQSTRHHRLCKSRLRAKLIQQWTTSYQTPTVRDSKVNFQPTLNYLAIKSMNSSLCLNFFNGVIRIRHNNQTQITSSPFLQICNIAIRNVLPHHQNHNPIQF